ncbi:MAG: SAM-dependent DNA methyltransferase [Enterococcus sp.]|nr:SAM-dependent DNA methyltransferase [Enterococcus sp.]
MSEFLQSSLDYTLNTPLEHRKKNGQYMTPRAVSSLLLDRLPIKDGDRVLDPAVGTGELLYAASERVPGASYEGWDIDETILKYTSSQENMEFFHRDALSVEATPQYDVIIANPPYFEFKLNIEQKRKFLPVIGGRVNIFTLFFYQSLNLLKDGGYLGFIVPPSMDNGAYFKNLRRWLLDNAELKDLFVINKSDHFIDAQTAAQIIVFQKKSGSKNHKFVFRSVDKSNGVDNPIFTTDVDYLSSAWEEKHSLWDLGYVATTGSVAWNQFKGKFLSDGLPLLYSKDITAQGMIAMNPLLDDRHYLPDGIPGKVTTPAIVVNRITGAVGSGALRAALYTEGDFYGENHVNVITPRTGVEQKITLEELFKQVTAVDSKYLGLLTGNTQISAKELTHHIPF